MDIVFVSPATLYALRGDPLPSWMRRVAYVLLDSKCYAGCSYCGLSQGLTKLARLPWYPVSLADLLERIDLFERVCIQSVVSPGAAGKLLYLVNAVREKGAKSVSVAIGAASPVFLEKLREAGVDAIGVGLDVSIERLARATRRPYSIDRYFATIRWATRIYGMGRVYAHIIVGLGENAETLANMLDKVYAMGARAALFAHVPIGGGTKPPLCYYRGAQIYKQLLEEGLDPRDYIEPGYSQNWIIRRIPAIDLVRKAVRTSGCPLCNRPYYTESPRGPLYNIPWEPSIRDARRAVRELLACSAHR